MRILKTLVNQIETSNFLTHIPPDQYLKGKWAPGRIFVSPQTFEKLKNLKGEELQQCVNALRPYRPVPEPQ